VIGTAKVLGAVYLAISAVAFVVLLLSGMPLFDALCHAPTSVSTGGFSTRAGSIGAFAGPAVPISIGAINFAIYPRLLRNRRALLQSVQVRAFALILLPGIFGLLLTISSDGPGVESFSDAAFQALSALTTAGFSTLAIAPKPDTAKGVLTALMWVDGTPGSTAGGIKIARHRGTGEGRPARVRPVSSSPARRLRRSRSGSMLFRTSSCSTSSPSCCCTSSW